MAERRQKTLRDMAISMGLIAVVALVLYGMYGGVTFSPGAASDGVAPTADVTGGLNRAAPLVGFPVVDPGGAAGRLEPELLLLRRQDRGERGPARRWCAPAG